jgi:HemY protein
MRTLPALILLGLLVAAAVLIADLPGTVELSGPGWRVDTYVSVLVAGIVAAGFAMALLVLLVRTIVRGPRAFLHGRREKRRRQGYRALTQGMVAVAAGDAEEAQKFARKADVLLAEPPLTLLLSAQAAQLNGDDHAARKYFTAMLERAETEFLGLRGLIMHALRGGDEKTALGLIERAKALRPRTPWVLSSLFELQSRAGKWLEAEATLAEAIKRKALAAIESRQHQAVLLHEKSRAAEAAGETGEALKQAAKAHAADPGFAPAAARYANLLHMGGRKRKAAKVIENAWRSAPHPALAEAYGSLFSEEAPLARIKRVERLVAGNPEHRESRIALAGAALAARLWGEARRHLEAAGAAPRDGAPPAPPRLCRLMAELEMADHGNHAAARGWLDRAAATNGLDEAYVCDACGAESTEWSALCPRCRAFNTLSWRVPGGTPVPRVAQSPALMPALPVPAWPTGTAARPQAAAARMPAGVDGAGVTDVRSAALAADADVAQR